MGVSRLERPVSRRLPVVPWDHTPLSKRSWTKVLFSKLRVPRQVHFCDGTLEPPPLRERSTWEQRPTCGSPTDGPVPRTSKPLTEPLPESVEVPQTDRPSPSPVGTRGGVPSVTQGQSRCGRGPTEDHRGSSSWQRDRRPKKHASGLLHSDVSLHRWFPDPPVGVGLEVDDEHVSGTDRGGRDGDQRSLPSRRGRDVSFPEGDPVSRRRTE